MPARKIPKNYRNVTGLLPSEKNGRSLAFESTLELDFLLLCEFDPNVASYEEQPVRIDYVDENRRARHYTPDALVTYRDDVIPAKWLRPMLCEVKYRADLKNDWPVLRRKMRAAQQYAKSRDWEFRVVTEWEIRTPYLTNARFLLPYRSRPSDEALEGLLLDWIHELRETTPEVLLARCFRDPELRASLIPSLWKLIGWQRIWCDLTVPLTMTSRIWEVDSSVPRFNR
jgi:hypothetical protein